MKKGLNKEIVIKEAVKLVVDDGFDKLSVRELAARLSIKPASLYNHIEGIEDLQLSVAEAAGDMLQRVIADAAAQENWQESFKKGATAYLMFAKEHKELYRALISVPKLDTDRGKEIGKKTFYVFMEILHGCGVDESNCLHFVRIFRSYIHGFIELCENGFMTHGSIDRMETFEFGVNEFIGLLERFVKEER